jgi:UTP--glucose-1-phosphate uridylyltransferase
LIDVDGYCKPTLQIIVDEVLQSGIDEICIVANETNLPHIRAHFQGIDETQQSRFAGKDWALRLSEDLEEMRRRITYVVQERQEGYGHAVFQARDWAGGYPVLVLLGDHVYLSPGVRCARQVADVYERYDAPVSSVATMPESMLPRVGVVRGEPIDGHEGGYRITAMAEKPSSEFARQHLITPGLAPEEYLCFFGIHAFGAEIFSCLDHLITNDIRVKNEIQLTSAQELLLRQSPLYVACGVNGERYDIGVPEGYVESQVAFALHSPFASRVNEAVQHSFAIRRN